MYQVLLVDDEVVDLEWLKRMLPWGDLRLEIASAENSGFAALHVLERQKIDILVTDIKMPIMSGLELAQKARELQPDIKIAFVSGHDDFHFAKQAIRVNAFGYVLKPVDGQELMQLLRSMVTRLDQEIVLTDEHRRLKESILLVKDELVHQWLEGEVGKIDFEILRQYGLDLQDRKGCVAVIEVDDIHWKFGLEEEEERREVLSQVMGLLEGEIREKRLGYYYRAPHSRITLIIGNPDETGGQRVLDDLVRHVRENSRLTVTAGLGCECTSPEGYIASYRQAKEALSYKMFVGKSRIITLDHTKEKAVQSALNLEEKLGILFTAILNYDLVGIDDHLEELFRFVKELDTKVTVFNFVVHVISRLDGLLKKTEENLFAVMGWEIKDLDVVFKFETVDDIKAWLRRRLFELSELLLIRKQKQDRKLIDDIKRYVTERLEDKVTLKDVANAFGFSPNYLGHIFKEATAENFSDYLLRLRMERACEYLLDPKVKIYEIVDRIGYKNILYFNRQFKDFYGYTPSDYRKRNKV